MIKIAYLIVALALTGSINCQEAAEQNAAPEPYSYGYETDTHSAAEQKDPSGAVTGFYTITDVDGRQRRVEYVADAAGFRAKVQTNEVGTKSANSADVEVLASPPNPEQLVYQAPAQQQTYQVQRQQVATVAPQQQRLVTYQPQAGYFQSANYQGYYPNNGYYAAGSYPYGAYGAQYGYQSAYPSGSYYSYNNHLPSQYYSSLQGGANSGVRYVTGNQPNYQTIGQRTSYQTSQVLPATSYASSSSSQTRSGNLAGSSNYIVLKKRASEEKKSS